MVLSTTSQIYFPFLHMSVLEPRKSYMPAHTAPPNLENARLTNWHTLATPLTPLRTRLQVLLVAGQGPRMGRPCVLSEFLSTIGSLWTCWRLPAICWWLESIA